LKLHGYQEVARDFLQGRPQAGLFLDLGLGKTATTLSALTPDHLPALVIPPKRVAEHVWPSERALWRPDLSLSLAIGEPAKRRAALDAGADLTVLSRDNIRDAVGRRYRTIVLDELSSFKAGHSGMRWKAARKITSLADVVWGLTGTPTPNGYLDLWPQIFLLDRGKRLGTSVVGYRNRYFIPTKYVWNGNQQVPVGYELREGAEERIKDLLEDMCLYMEAADYLPGEPPTYNNIEVELPSSVRKLYEQMRKDLVVDMELIGGDVFSAANQAVLTNKLAQITAGFIYSDEQDGTYTDLHNAKLEALQEVREGTGDNLLVFYSYIPEAERIRKAFPEAVMLDDPGAIAGWMKGEVPMLLCHPASAGHGLNLQSGGHTIVWASMTWDLELYLQANGRLDRQGQKHPVVIHKLLCPDSVDMDMDARLEGKEFTQDGFLDHMRSPI
jgi:SNF2 family DNA or RNA helicase